jgi:23S rRNA (adenine2503-C2)-methyltransferase
MNILKNIKVPTGNILIVSGDKGKLECVSLGDYGKENNLKADFLGLTKEITKVESQKIMPLTDKWVITISTQYDLKQQIITGLSTHPNVKSTKRLNIHYARMGEPTWNYNVIGFTKEIKKELYPYIGDSLIHPVISTMMPKGNRFLRNFLEDWMYIKNRLFNGDAGLQFSINSTSDKERNEMFNGNSIDLKSIAYIGKQIQFPEGRKITLNFAVAGYEIDANKLKSLFDPKKFVVKLTPMHKTSSALQNDIKTTGDYTTFYPYKHIEEQLKAVGFDVLVFIASDDEDLGRITCGNAILSGSMPECNYSIVGDKL